MKAQMVILHGHAARQTIRAMARSYALLCIHSRLPVDTVNRPWQPVEGSTQVRVHAAWIAKVDRERADYRKSLESLVVPVPDVPLPEWKPYVGVNSKRYSVNYRSELALAAAKKYAADFMGLIK